MRERQRKRLLADIDLIRESSLADQIDDVILYGSCARGQEKFNSDIDLLIQFSDSLEGSKNKIRKEITELKTQLWGDNINDPETDVHFVFGDSWRNSDSLYYVFIQKEGISLWK